MLATGVLSLRNPNYFSHSLAPCDIWSADFLCYFIFYYCNVTLVLWKIKQKYYFYVISHASKILCIYPRYTLPTNPSYPPLSLTPHPSLWTLWSAHKIKCWSDLTQYCTCTFLRKGKREGEGPGRTHHSILELPARKSVLHKHEKLHGYRLQSTHTPTHTHEMPVYNQQYILSILWGLMCI